MELGGKTRRFWKRKRKIRFGLLGQYRQRQKLAALERRKPDAWTRNRQNAILILGIMLTGLGISQLPTIWTFKSDLTQLKGTIQAIDTYVTTVTESRRGHKSQKAELIFYLNEYKQKYYLAENIGDDYHDDKYQNILQGLKRADSVSVWIKKSELDEFEPQVFQIDNDKRTLLDFEAVRMSESLLTFFLLLLGPITIAFFFYLRYPDRFDKVFGINENTT